MSMRVDQAFQQQAGDELSEQELDQIDGGISFGTIKKVVKYVAGHVGGDSGGGGEILPGFNKFLANTKAIAAAAAAARPQ